MSDSEVSFSDLINANQDIYVRNEQKGVLIIVCYQNGHPRPIRIPKSKHPFFLSSKASPQALNESVQLRDALYKGYLTLLDPKAARAELDKPGVRDKVVAAERSLGSGNTAVAQHRERRPEARVLPSLTDVDPHQDIEFAGTVDDKELEERIDAVDINPRVTIICSLLAEAGSGKDPKEAREELRQMDDELTQQDLEFIIEHTRGIVREYAQNELALRLGTKT